MPSDLHVGIATPNDQGAWDAFVNARVLPPDTGPWPLFTRGS